MNKDFDKKMQQAGQGKEIFAQMFDFSKLSIEDTFLLVLTDDEKCINYGIKYLLDFIELYERKKVYVLLDGIQYIEVFSKSGGIVKVCTKSELQKLAEYFNLFHKKEYFDAQIVFLTEKDGHGLFVEELLNKKEFTLEEYVAISLYGLKGLKQGRQL